MAPRRAGEREGAVETGVPEEWSKPVRGSNTGIAILSNSGAKDRSRGPRECPAGAEFQHSQPWG